MEAIDTNILIRLLVKDEPHQSQLAETLWRQLLAKGTVYITKVVMVETVWVMQRSYQFSRQQIVEVANLLLRTDGVIVEDAAQVKKALKLFATQQADFSDYVIVASCDHAQALPLHTFDKKLASHENVTLLV